MYYCYFSPHPVLVSDQLQWCKGGKCRSVAPALLRWFPWCAKYDIAYPPVSRCKWDRLSETKSSIAFCPTSNLYLGSGLFNLKKAWQKKVKVGMGTDIGAGTTFNMLQTLNEAYKVLQLQGYRLSAYEAFYLATLGGAKSLGLDDLIGNFLPGKEADFVVMEPTATPLQQLRYDNSVSLVDKLFVMMTLGDDRSIYRTYVDGRLVYERN